ncbi:MAG TPA: hypothetical protein DCY86_15330 [Bdellovibrionales bacterium]|nr:hypothetical protein [Bdellovibrionales bacterium]
MGASGGHGRSATILGASDGGAAGGGIIALYAREIIIGSGTASFTVSARGISGDSSLTNGGGGGAGGSVFAFTQYLNRPFDMNAQGGSGRGGSGGGSGAGGGGGGGGRILLRSCYWGGSAPTFNTQGGAGGPDSPPTGSGSPGGPGYEGDENGTLANILNPAFSFCL